MKTIKKITITPNIPFVEFVMLDERGGEITHCEFFPNEAGPIFKSQFSAARRGREAKIPLLNDQRSQLFLIFPPDDQEGVSLQFGSDLRRYRKEEEAAILHLLGSFSDEVLIFDSSIHRGEPLFFLDPRINDVIYQYVVTSDQVRINPGGSVSVKGTHWPTIVNKTPFPNITPQAFPTLK